MVAACATTCTGASAGAGEPDAMGVFDGAHVNLSDFPLSIFCAELVARQ